MSAAPRIHVLLPVHNRRATTEKFLRCLAAQTYDNWHLVLIDDGSKDDTESMARALVPSATVLRGTGSWWWAGALQQGHDWLKRENVPADDLVFINNDDTQIDPDFFARAVSAVRPRSLLLAQQYNLAGQFLEAGVHWDWKALTARSVAGADGINCFSTRGLFLRKGDFLEIGGFHPVLLPHYLSDYEFTLRAARKGFAFMTDPNVFLRYDDSLTGVHGIDDTSFFRSLRRIFSVRSSSNPVYWTSFILLGCPGRYIPLNLLRSWGIVLMPLWMRLVWLRKRLRPVKRAVKSLFSSRAN